LTPPPISGEGWTESVLWDFGVGADGTDPREGVVMDKSGNLYGTTPNGGTLLPGVSGTVFELTPPATTGDAWTESILWDFAGTTKGGLTPIGGVIRNPNGNLFGTTFYGGARGSGGTVFEILP
jgi:hypothetical protein